MARCTGTPIAIRTGMLISPPPPAIESTKAAKNPPIHKKITENIKFLHHSLSIFLTIYII